eukprot:CAMPEP_0167800618 /NCGR_PEP_ID=MMETSP0111_2-20121227/17857_1 /TAXON_ID=91324 /ORGANISM="Lotharella globosa, Strain CCCM811" /LENGTH=83 /DNA_ID=CAMNT_0007695949 /DNA_START=442 /DNA_END=693 /DNA_ORIENTATION=+
MILVTVVVVSLRSGSSGAVGFDGPCLQKLIQPSARGVQHHRRHVRAVPGKLWSLQEEGAISRSWHACRFAVNEARANEHHEAR